MDERLLAEAIAAAAARGLHGAHENYFVNAEGSEAKLETATGCCALAALVLAGRARFYRDRERYPGPLPKSIDPKAIALGNDKDVWGSNVEDRGETMGHAFQLAVRKVHR